MGIESPKGQGPKAEMDPVASLMLKLLNGFRRLTEYRPTMSNGSGAPDEKTRLLALAVPASTLYEKLGRRTFTLVIVHGGSDSDLF